MANFDVLQLDSLEQGNVLHLIPQGTGHLSDSLDIISSSEQPLARILALNGLRVNSKEPPIRILGACTRESYLDRSPHQLPEDFVRGSIIGGMRYLMRGGGNTLFLSPNIVMSAFANRKNGLSTVV